MTVMATVVGTGPPCSGTSWVNDPQYGDSEGLAGGGNGDGPGIPEEAADPASAEAHLRKKKQKAGAAFTAALKAVVPYYPSITRETMEERLKNDLPQINEAAINEEALEEYNKAVAALETKLDNQEINKETRDKKRALAEKKKTDAVKARDAAKKAIGSLEQKYKAFLEAEVAHKKALEELGGKVPRQPRTKKPGVWPDLYEKLVNSQKSLNVDVIDFLQTPYIEDTKVGELFCDLIAVTHKDVVSEWGMLKVLESADKHKYWAEVGFDDTFGPSQIQEAVARFPDIGECAALFLSWFENSEIPDYASYRAEAEDLYQYLLKVAQAAVRLSVPPLDGGETLGSALEKIEEAITTHYMGNEWRETPPDQLWANPLFSMAFLASRILTKAQRDKGVKSWSDVMRKIAEAINKHYCQKVPGVEKDAKVLACEWANTAEAMLRNAEHSYSESGVGGSAQASPP